MAIAEWSWYTHEGDKSDLFYFANTEQTMQELHDYIIKTYNKRRGGFFKRFFRKLFFKKASIYIYEMSMFTDNNCLCIYFRLADLSDPLKFTFTTYKPHAIDIEFGLGEELIDFDSNEVSVKGMLNFMEYFAKYVLDCIKNRDMYKISDIIDSCLKDLQEASYDRGLETVLKQR